MLLLELADLWIANPKPWAQSRRGEIREWRSLQKLINGVALLFDGRFAFKLVVF